MSPSRSRRHLPDLVEEERASVGFLEEAGPAPVRAREGARDVSGQLAFQKRLGDAGTVHGDERTAAAIAFGVDRPGGELLADTSFPG